MDNPYYLALFFFLIAIFYSSVGFGGGSSYLAILVLAGVELYLLRSTALMCNIIVASSGTYIFYKEGYLNIRMTSPLVLASMPMAFLGGYLPIREGFIFIILGFALFTAAILLWIKKSVRSEPQHIIERSSASAGIIGGIIGFISGMVGIGGGIFLSPVLNFINWSNAKKIAAIASLFILANSVAGLAGQWLRYPLYIDLNWMWPLLVAVLLGGQIGSRLSVLRFSNTTIRRTTAVLVMMAGLKILNDHLLHLDDLILL